MPAREHGRNQRGDQWAQGHDQGAVGGRCLLQAGKQRQVESAHPNHSDQRQHQVTPGGQCRPGGVGQAHVQREAGDANHETPDGQRHISYNFV